MSPKTCQYHTGARQLGREVLCGKQTDGGSYCSEHHALVYQPAKRPTDAPPKPRVTHWVGWGGKRQKKPQIGK